MAVNNKIKEINMEILTPGKLLKKARLEKNLSQIELAKKLGYTSSQMISNYEREICSVPVAKFKDLSKILKVNPRALLEAEVSRYASQLRAEIE